MLSDLKVTAIALAVGICVGAIGSWHLTAEYKDAKWGKAVERQKKEAAETMQAETEKVLAAERKNTELNNQLEKTHAEQSRKIESSLADNRHIARELGGLRDPGKSNTTSGMGVPQGTTSSNIANSSAEGQLSREASRFLLDFAEDADQAAAYANACYEWVNREKLKTLQIQEPVRP